MPEFTFQIMDKKLFFLKLCTLIVGVVDIVLTGNSYIPIFTEKPFLSVICIAFILSFFHLIAFTFGLMKDNNLSKRIVLFYHALTALLLFMNASVFLFSVMGFHSDCQGNDCGPFLTKRYFSAILGFINGILYGMVAWNLLDIKIVSKTGDDSTITNA